MNTVFHILLKSYTYSCRKNLLHPYYTPLRFLPEKAKKKRNVAECSSFFCYQMYLKTNLLLTIFL